MPSFFIATDRPITPDPEESGELDCAPALLATLLGPLIAVVGAAVCALLAYLSTH